MRDMLEELTTVCAECGTDKEPAGWCPVWNVHLCFVCRAKRTDAELRMKFTCKPPGISLPPDPVLQL